MAAPEPTRAQASSSFDTDAGGWLAATYPVRGPYDAPLAQPPLTHHVDGGTPGGYVEIEDPDNHVVFWQAPPSFLGDQSGAYGGALTFDLLNSAPITYTDDYDVVLRGGELTVRIELEAPAQAAWTSYAVGLSEAFEARSGWTAESGEPATEAELRGVLAGLEALLIRAEHSNTVAGEFMGLDNPALALGTASGERTTVPGGDLALTGPSPNPLVGTGTVRVRADRPQAARAELFDLLGRSVGVVFEGVLGAGETAIPLDATTLPPGLYALRVQTRRGAVTRRLTVGR